MDFQDHVTKRADGGRRQPGTGLPDHNKFAKQLEGNPMQSVDDSTPSDANAFSETRGAPARRQRLER
ncbi:MAG TPA: hypothetical protein VGB18_02070 [Candidatus Thermoplasmatota archaeon]